MMKRVMLMPATHVTETVTRNLHEKFDAERVSVIVPGFQKLQMMA